MDGVGYDPLQAVLCDFDADSEHPMRRVNVGYLNRAELLAPQSCVVAECEQWGDITSRKGLPVVGTSVQ